MASPPPDDHSLHDLPPSLPPSLPLLSSDHPPPQLLPHPWNLSDDPNIRIACKSSRHKHFDSIPHGTQHIAPESCPRINPASGTLHDRTWIEQPDGSSRRPPDMHNQAESKWLSAADSSSRPGFSGASSSNDQLLTQFDSSDNSDGMDDADEPGKLRPSKGAVSKNLVSERKRRKKLNERLYSLRAIVPTISKMDKASIVGDAINYVRDLQKQVEEMQADIASLEANAAVGDAGFIIDLKKDGRRARANSYAKKPVQSYEIVELEVSQMGEHTFHLRIHCKKSPGVLVQLTRALEALDFEILNANLTLVNELVLNTILVEVKNGAVFNPEELRQMTLDVVPRFGLLAYSL